MPPHRLVVLLLLSLASLAQQQATPPPPPSPRSTKLAVFITGETFRANSHQNSRETGLAGFEPQREAVAAQVALFTALRAQYEHVAVWLETPATPWSANLTAWYGPFLTPARTLLKGAEQSNAEPVTVTMRFLQSFDSLLSVVFEYDAVLLLRADLVPTPVLACTLAAAPRDKVLFPYVMNKNTLDLPPQLQSKFGKNVDRVCDAFVWLPRWTFEQGLVDLEKLYMSHYALLHALPTYGGDHIAYVFPWGQFDSDPAKGRNPLYGLAARMATQALAEFSATSINVSCEDVRYAVASGTLAPRSGGFRVAGCGLRVPKAPAEAPPPGG